MFRQVFTLILAAAFNQSCDPEQADSEFRRLPVQTVVEESKELSFDEDQTVEAVFEAQELSGLKVSIDSQFLTGGSVVLSSSILSREGARELKLSSSQELKEGATFEVDLPVAILGAEGEELAFYIEAGGSKSKIAGVQWMGNGVVRLTLSDFGTITFIALADEPDGDGISEQIAASETTAGDTTSTGSAPVTENPDAPSGTSGSSSASGTSDSSTPAEEVSVPQLANLAAASFELGSAITALSIVNSGAAAVTCTITPALPTGLTIAVHSGSCQISGTPTAAQAATTHTVTATSASSESATATVQITTFVPPNPPILANAVNQTYTTTVTISSLNFANTGANALSCAVSPALPDGLSVAASLNTCRISGTPTEAQVATTHTVTATAADSSQATATVQITVNVASPPTIANIDAALELVVDAAMTPASFTNSGSDAVDCEVDPDLPDGLSVAVDSATCQLTGTPTSLQSSATYTVTATAADGSSDSATVSISVVAAPLTCPTGYIPVPEYTDDDTGTVPAFCVMKYEAKNDGSNNAISQAIGTPYGYINRAAAITKCQAVSVAGYDFDLISNSQWQSIARQIERYEVEGIYVNWQNGSVSGSNALNRGFLSSAGYGIAASSNDAEGCTGTSTPVNCNNTWMLEKRTHTLPNGEIIWDLAGGLVEWVSDMSSIAYADAMIGYWFNATSETGNACLSPECTGPQGKPKAAFGPYGDFTGKSANPYGGLGYAANVQTTGTHGLLRGGDGIFGIFKIIATATHHSWDPDVEHGFRCVAVPES